MRRVNPDWQRTSLFFLMLGILVLPTPWLASAQIKQGAELLKVDVMAIVAHPDDETGMATALASLALKEGASVANIYCTRGEGGGNMVGTHWGPSLGVLREAELRDCLNRLGVRYCFFLDQRDWAYTESMSATLRAWDKEQAMERLVRYIRALRPEVILTMNPTPNPGQHGHHQSAAILATEAFVAAADPNRFSEQLTREGLSVWQARKLYSTGALSEYGVEISGSQEIGDTSLARIVGEALSNHRSQGFGRMLGAPWLNRPRWFSLVKSVTPFARESSFFDGLPVEGLTPTLATPPGRGTRDRVPSVTARLEPRPAITRYENWVKAMDVEHIAMEFLPDVPVRLGEVNALLLEVHNPFATDQRVTVRLSSESGIEISPAEITRAFPPGPTRFPFAATPAEGGDHELLLEVVSGEQTSRSKAILHTVPTLSVPRVSAVPGLNSERDAWRRAAVLSIDERQRVQGKVEHADDSRAEVRLLHDGTTLAVEVRVWDDVIVSNIAANDVRGHWRSDSVEVCIDPEGGAEDSFGSYKVGVFPFVEGLGPRGARDADANQGPLERTAPDTRLASERLDDGYRIRLHIPLEEAGIRLPIGEAGTQLDPEALYGFNVIIYDGDKANAAMGENINESRIAWSPRSGVQGRPEDWGRIRLR